MRDDATFYQVLGVAPDADTDAIEAAYRDRVKEYHPDVSDHPEARDRFQRINRARAVLTDPAERARYDRLGHEAYLERERRGRTAHDDTAADAAGDSGAGGSSGSGHGGRSGPGAGGAAEPGGGGPSDPGRDVDATSSRHANAGRERDTRARLDTAGRLPGWFALREALSGGVVLATAAGAVALTARFGDAVAVAPDRLLLVGCWVVVAVLAGALAASSAGALPDDVLRAQALPLGLLAGAWALREAGAPALLVTGLVGYGAFAALFRTGALVARRGSTLRPAVCWFLGTAPAVLLLPVARLSVDGRGALLTLPASAAGGGIWGLVSGGGAVVALAAPFAVALGHATWRLGSVLVRMLT